jgi:hypothetical protein
MESVTSSLSFTAAVTYAAKLSTTSTDSSIQGLLGGLYFGVGKIARFSLCNWTSLKCYSISVLLLRNEASHHHLLLPWRLKGNAVISILPLFNSVMTTGCDELVLSHVFEITNLWERILFQTVCQVTKNLMNQRVLNKLDLGRCKKYNC